MALHRSLIANNANSGSRNIQRRVKWLQRSNVDICIGNLIVATTIMQKLKKEVDVFFPDCKS